MRFLTSLALIATLTAFAPAATLTVQFKVPAEHTKDITESSLRLRRVNQMLGMYETVAQKSYSTAGFSETFKDLPAGRYTILIHTGKITEVNDGNRKGAFAAKSSVLLGAVGEETTTFEYKAFDPTPFKGTASVSGRMLDPYGAGKAGIEVAAAIFDDSVGLYKLGTTKTGAEGNFEIGGLANQNTFVLLVGGEPKAEADAGGVPIMITLPPVVGEAAPDFPYTDTAAGKELKLSDHKGKIVYIDFWASWCQPCQAPLAELNDIFAKHPDWKDKVVILPVSIDGDREMVAAHLKTRGWSNLTPLWAGEGGFQSAGPAKFAVSGIPAAVIVNQAGIIVASGHPGEFDKDVLIKGLLESPPTPAP